MIHTFIGGGTDNILGGPTLHEVVEHDSLISLRRKGGLYWVMMESII